MNRHHISFRHALDGITTAFRTQPNFRIHLTLSLISVAAGIILNISALEWAVITFTIFTGLAIELINTSIEYVVNLITEKYNIFAKYAKDTAAAAMLVYAFGAVCVAVWIFLPRIRIIWPFT